MPPPVHRPAPPAVTPPPPEQGILAGVGVGVIVTVTLLVMLVVTGGIAVLLHVIFPDTSSSVATPAPTPTTQTPTATEPPETADLPTVGEVATVHGDVEWVVTGVERLTTIGEGEDAVPALGEYVLLHVDITCHRTPRIVSFVGPYYSSWRHQLHDANGRVHYVSPFVRLVHGEVNGAPLEAGVVLRDVPVLFDVPVGTPLDRVDLRFEDRPGTLVGLVGH